MKKILALIALGLSASLVSFTAAAHGPSPLKVDKSITIKADPAKVWALVKDFGNMHKWHPAIASTKLEKKGDDTFRTLTLKDGGTIVEKLRSADDADMKLRYEIVTSGLPLTDYNAFMIVSKGANAGEVNVQWVGRFYRLYKLNPPIPAGQDDETALNAINGIFDAGLAGLKKAGESSK
ncbi:MAG: SRPBCC family protein [Methylotenera sp.]|nr:SRPBCC family protein [Methylotenera sp.]MDO9233394.1 SRPBCC family protein [Methylotenera sp.]MDO9389311.1 SRPBCC family protein [Methylotenera sp.]MDP2101869.1 SRPBCC family protein [Methylotenera sp.]MDP2280795.1 SRPBCC family protein [Methylotenera sp.]